LCDDGDLTRIEEVSVRHASRIVSVGLAVVYVAFWIWYGGSGEPLTPGEVARLTAEMEAGARARGAEPDDTLIEAFRTLAAQDDGREFYMVNLMRYRERAVYPEGSPWDDDAEAAAARYGRAVIPALVRRGSLPILLGSWEGTFLQPGGADEWDQVGIVRYRSRRDMLEMAAALSHTEAGTHKWASIEKTHVFPIRPVFDFVFVRGAVAAVLIAIGSLVHLGARLLAGRAP